MKPGLSTEQVTAAVADFMASYAGHIPLKPHIVERQEDAYGPDCTFEQLGHTIAGAYHPARQLFTVAASNLHSAGELERLLRRNLLGHYGLDTFRPEEKNDLLSRILESYGQPDVADLWNEVIQDSQEHSPLEAAETLFARVAEQQRPFISDAWSRVRSSFQGLLRKTGLSSAPLSYDELRTAALDVAQGIRSGKRQQQSFALSDTSLDRVSSPVAPQFTQEMARAGARVAAGIAARQALTDTSELDNLPWYTSDMAVLITPRVHQGERVGWDCQQYHEQVDFQEPAYLVFGTGLVLESVTQGRTQSWVESPTLSTNAEAARVQMANDVQHLLGLPEHTTTLTHEQAITLTEQCWEFHPGIKNNQGEHQNTYTDPHGQTCELPGDCITMYITQRDGTVQQQVAWFDAKALLHKQLLDRANLYPEPLREATVSLFSYVHAGCPGPDELDRLQQQLELGAELFSAMPEHLQEELRAQGVSALESALVEFAGLHNPYQQNPASHLNAQQHTGPQW